MQPPGTRPEVLHLELVNEIQEVRRLRAEVESFASRTGIPEDCQANLFLALEEAVVNVIRYAWDDGRHVVTVRLIFANDELDVVVEDDGRPFNPLNHPPFDPDAPLEKRRGGGMGIHIVRHLTDDLTYERLENRNRLRLSLRLPRASRRADGRRSECSDQQ